MCLQLIGMYPALMGVSHILPNSAANSFNRSLEGKDEEEGLVGSW